MPIDEAVDQISTSPTTRRSIIKTGAKLTYAVPAVAVTMKLSAGNASAAVSGCKGSRVACQGEPGFAYCDGPNCDMFGRPACICSADTEGNYTCSDTCFVIGGRPNCTKSSDCAEAGNVCKEFCGGVYYCVAPCRHAKVVEGAGAAEAGGDPTAP